MVGVKVDVGLTLGVVVAVMVGEGVVVTVKVGEIESVGDGVFVGVKVAVGMGERLGVTEGAPIGSIGEALFCGCGKDLATKSEELLFVSSAFPINSSIPPTAIETLVEDVLAFLSTLVEAVGAVSDRPSPRLFVTVPKVTESTRVPVFNAPFLSPMLLLLAIDPLVERSQLRVVARFALHHRK